MPLLLVLCLLVAFPGGEPLGSPGMVFWGTRLSCSVLYKDLPVTGTRGAFSFVSGLRVHIIHQLSGVLWARGGNVLSCCCLLDGAVCGGAW